MRSVRPNPLEVRERVLDAVESKETTVSAVAKVNKISRKTVYTWRRAARSAGGKVPAPGKPGRPRATALYGSAIADLVEFARQADPPARTTKSLGFMLAAYGGPVYCEKVLIRRLREWGFTSRKLPADGDIASQRVWTAPATMLVGVQSPGVESPAWLSPEIREMITEFVLRQDEYGFHVHILLDAFSALRIAMRRRGGTLEELEAHLIVSGCVRKGDRFYGPGIPLDKIR